MLTRLVSIVKVSIKSRIVTVEGPRGKLVKDLSHLAVNFTVPKKNQISIEIHHGVRKNVATLRTVRTLINNLIIGVTKGFKYKMRYVYAHFPINVNVSKSDETDLYEVEIRNFIGEKLVRRIVMHPGVEVEASTTQKDELVLSGNSLENVSQSAADIQQICRVRNKDIRKVGFGLGFLWLQYANSTSSSSWTVCTFPRRATLSRTNKRGHGHGSCFFCVSGSQEWRRFIVACHVAKKGLQNNFKKQRDDDWCRPNT